MLKIITLSFCFLALLFFSSCARRNQPGKQANSSAAQSSSDTKVATPAGESSNWKVTVLSTERVPKQSEPAAGRVRTPKILFDQLRVTLDLEYKGPEGDIPAPATALVDDQNRRFEQLTVGFTIPPGKEIKGGPEDPAWKDMDELGNWFFSSAPDKKTKKAEPELRKLKTGDKFSLFYTFEDPKSPNIKLVFGDVSPVALPPPQEEKKSP